MGSTPAAIWAGRQWRRPKTRKSIRPPRAFGKRIGLTKAGSRSSASTALAWSGTARFAGLEVEHTPGDGPVEDLTGVPVSLRSDVLPGPSDATRTRPSATGPRFRFSPSAAVALP